MSIEDLYKEIIIDHYRNPRNRGVLDSPPATRVEGFNPLCGDEITLYVDVEDSKIADLKMEGQGCSISLSSASMMTEAVIGIPVDDVRAKIDAFKDMMSVKAAELSGQEEPDMAELGASELGELEALKGVVKFPVRIKCATLSWNALAQGLLEAEAGTGGSSTFVESEEGDVDPSHFKD